MTAFSINDDGRCANCAAALGAYSTLLIAEFGPERFCDGACADMWCDVNDVDPRPRRIFVADDPAPKDSAK